MNDINKKGNGMYFEEDTLDDLMNEVFKVLLKNPFEIESTRGKLIGKSSEIIGATLKLTNPRARLSRTETKGTLFSALGETLWYLSKESNLDFIKYYIKRYEDETEDGKTIYGGYGSRLFNSGGEHNQIENVINLLKKKATSRRAAIQIFESKDLAENHKEIPCTCTLQFMIRNELLHMVVYMRSNDVYLGLPHDVFAFTMLQEIFARTLEVEIGTYTHCVGSLHLYEKNKKDAECYINEGFQSTKKLMEPMPLGNPWDSIQHLLSIECKCRLGEKFSWETLDSEPYWRDLALILQIFSLIKRKEIEVVTSLLGDFTNEAYKVFVEKRLDKVRRK